MALHPARRDGRVREPDLHDLADEDGPLAGWPSRGSSTTRAPLSASTPSGSPCVRPSVVAGERDIATGRELTLGPVGDIEATVAKRLDADFEPTEERVEQGGQLDRPTSGSLAQ